MTMSKIACKLQWNKNVYELEVDTTEDVDTLKAQIFCLTNVPVEGQKILKPIIRQKEHLAKLKAGDTIRVMGTADEAMAAHKKAAEEAKAKPTVFAEDMTEAQRAKALKIIPGMQNLGNTCYLNSAMQAIINRVDPIRDALLTGTSKPGAEPTKLPLYQGIQMCIKSLDSSPDAIAPMMLINSLRQAYPQFAEKAQNGAPAQQDAQEYLNAILTNLNDTMAPGADGRSPVEANFDFTIVDTYKCLENQDEPATKSTNTQRLLQCHVGTATQPVGTLHDGVKLSLSEKIEKNSPTLGRVAEYEKTSAIATLPEYLLVHFVRFAWKGKSDAAGTEARKVKVCRPIRFGAQTNMYDFCTDDLKKELLKGRRIQAKIQDIKDEQAKIFKPKDEEDDKMEVEGASGYPKGDAGADTEMEEEEQEFPTGAYDLIGVVGHQGQSADGGHYVGLGRTKKAEKRDDDEWRKFDDEKVDIQENIKDFYSGSRGAAEPIAYLVAFKLQTVKATPKLIAEADKFAQVQEEQAKEIEEKKKQMDEKIKAREQANKESIAPLKKKF